MQQSKRNISIDFIKCLAIFSVIGVHFILNTNNTLIIGSNTDVFVYLSYRQIFIVCVPLFFLTTGYLNINKEPNIKYYRKIFSILEVYFFYSVLSLLFRSIYLGETISISAGIKLIFSFQAIPYAWYINMFIGLYLLVPFLNKITKNSSKKEYELFILVLFIISVIPATWNNFTSIIGYSNIIPLPDFWMSVYPITYYMIGSYFRLYPVATVKKHFLCTAFSSYIISIIINYSYSSIDDISNIIKDYSSLFILIQSASLFLLFLNSKKDYIVFKKFITSVSNVTLEVYLVSYIVDQLVYSFFNKYVFSHTVIDYIYSIPIVLCVFFLSFSIVILFKKLQKRLLTGLINKKIGTGKKSLFSNDL